VKKSQKKLTSKTADYRIIVAAIVMGVVGTVVIAGTQAASNSNELDGENTSTSVATVNPDQIQTDDSGLEISGAQWGEIEDYAATIVLNPNTIDENVVALVDGTRKTGSIDRTRSVEAVEFYELFAESNGYEVLLDFEEQKDSSAWVLLFAKGNHVIEVQFYPRGESNILQVATGNYEL